MTVTDNAGNSRDIPLALRVIPTLTVVGPETPPTEGEDITFAVVVGGNQGVAQATEVSLTISAPNGGLAGGPTGHGDRDAEPGYGDGDVYGCDAG